MTKAEKIAASLTEAQKRALTTAFEMSDGSGLHLRIAVNRGVRRRIYEMGLMTKRPAYPLNKLGREVRAILLREES